MEKFLDMIKKKRYTLLASDSLFQYPVNRESVSFPKTERDRRFFFYRIYVRELFLHLMYRLRNINRGNNEVKSQKIKNMIVGLHAATVYQIEYSNVISNGYESYKMFCNLFMGNYIELNDNKEECSFALMPYANNGNLYAGLIVSCNNEEEGWEPYLTINQHSLPTFYVYVDNRDYNERAHEFLIRYEIAEPTNLFPVMEQFQILPFQP